MRAPEWLRVAMFAVAFPAVLTWWGALAPVALAETLEATLQRPNGYYAENFGWSVDITADGAAVGAIGSRTVEVFVRSGSAWSHQATIQGAGSDRTDGYAWSVAMDGDTIVAGVPQDKGTALRAGTAYVYARNGTTWSEQAKLAPGDLAAEDGFGWSVAVLGDLIAIGAAGHDHGGTADGVVYLFRRTGGVWAQVAEIPGPGGSPFGGDVSLTSDAMLVGAAWDSTLGYGAGAAHVMRWSGTTFVHEAKLLATDGASQDAFARAVAIDRTVAVVGAPFDDDRGADSGSVYVFRRSRGGWTQEAKLTDPRGGEDDLLGWSVDVHRGRIVAGASEFQGGQYGGRGLLFVRRLGSWSAGRPLDPPGAHAHLGYSAATWDDRHLLGAPTTDGLTGTAYVFRSYEVIEQILAADER